MITFQEAVETILSLSTSWGTEFVPLEKAAGRTLAETIKADRDYPPFDRAAMDGFAVRSEDILDKKITRFHVVGELFAGSDDQLTVRPGEALKIMTGAPVPRTADAVIKKEDAVDDEPGTVTFRTVAFERRQCIARKGEDIRAGHTVFSHGVLITPGCLSVLASLGKMNVRVAKLPGVALISTGNEIKSVEDPVASYQIRDANRYSIEGFLFNYSIRPSSARIVRDEIDALTDAIGSALTNDIIILTGGVSAGDADLVPQALAACGVQEIFHKVKIRPGKPIWFGRHPGGARVFALPGNPFSVQAACRLFIEPYLRACFDLPAAEPVVLPMGRAKMKRVDFDEFFPAKISNLRGAHIELLHHHSSGDITAVLDADGIAHHPAQSGDLMDGEFVDLYLWKNIR